MKKSQDNRSSAALCERKLMKYMQELPESRLTTELLIPLMFALGYERVDYHGGPYESGKDIICWKADELGLPELAVAQVKRYRAGSRARDPESFMELVNQLQQAAGESVPNLDGKMYKASTVYFFTPYSIDTRALTTRFEGYSSLKNSRLKIVDGPLIIQLLQRHLPDLVRKISGTEVVVHSVIGKQLNNKTLLGGLGF
jgi:hypothetical protein